MKENKFLIVDTSGFDPIRYSISNRDMTMNDLYAFSIKANMQLCITDTILKAGEFSYSTNPELFTYRDNASPSNTAFSDMGDQSIKSCWLTSNGTITTCEGSGELEFKVLSVQATQTSSISYSQRLSSEDISNIFSANKLLKLGDNVAILVNDWDLKQQAQEGKIPAYGTCSFLAGMVLNDIYTYQKATKLYYKWKSKDKKWVPIFLSFQDILFKEKNRKKDRESFWFNFLNLI